MRVLLVIPTSFYKIEYPHYFSSQDFPVGFAYLASALQGAGHEVFGLNLNNDANYGSAFEMISARIEGSIREVRPDIIGIGGLCTDYKFIKDAIGIIRELSPDTPVVCGGGIINNDDGFIFPMLKPDFCIAGEAEEALVQLVNSIDHGDSGYEKIDNLGYWRDGKPQFNKRSFNYIDIDQLRFPDYEPFNIREMLDSYSLATRILHRYPRENPRPMTIVTARSCPFQCTFCVHHRREVKYRSRSVENIMDEIDYLYNRYEFNILVIHDELFASNKIRLKEFCDQLGDARKDKGWDFNWMFQTHASAGLDRETLKTAKDLGCYYFSYGLESSSPKVLASMNKKTKPQQIAEAIKAASDVGIGFGGNYIFGDIAETPKTICETVRFFKENALDNHIYLGVIHPYPGSRIFEYCLDKKIIPDKLRYYERIDEWDFNMTSIPDWIWFRWVSLLYRHAEQYTWVKSTNAISFSEYKNHDYDDYLNRTGQRVYRVRAKCPHCGGESVYYEPIKTAIEKLSQNNANEPAPPLMFRIKRAWSKTNRHGNLFLHLAAFVTFVLGEILVRLKNVINRIRKRIISSIINRSMMFCIIESLDIGGIHSKVSFITGCRHCNKRYRINVMYVLTSMAQNKSY